VIEFSSNAAFISVGAGVTLIYGELCVPGRILPGCAGAILALGGGYSLLQKAPTPEGAVLLGLGLVSMLYAAARRPSKLVAFTSLSCFCGGSVTFLRPPQQVSLWVAVPVSLLIGMLTITLLRVAIFARKRKRAL
jgi:membrane-bound ClpP family serine protease